MIRCLALAALLLAAPAAAQEIREPEIYTDFQGVAIRGYDTVAYFTDGAAVKGSPQFEAEWNGAKWHFASAEHRDLFLADPDAYAPQFGGYCAWAVYKDALVRASPEVFSIQDGKLYLNLNAEAQGKWLAQPGAIAGANSHWPDVLVLTR